MVAKRCAADAAAVAGERADLLAGWDFPTRSIWERGGRALTCMIAQPGYGTWTGPFVPAPEAGVPSAAEDGG